MRNTLLTTTALLMSVGVAHADVTFSGKAEVGVSRTAKVKAVAAVTGVQTQIGVGAQNATNGTYSTVTDGTVALTSATAIAVTAATGAAAAIDATRLAAAKLVLDNMTGQLGRVQHAVNTGGILDVTGVANEVATGAGTTDAAATSSVANNAIRLDALNYAKALVKQAQVAYNAALGTAAVAAVKAGDNVVYTGYDMNVDVSGAADNGMTFSAAFDMGAGSIADRDDDRVLDAQAAAIALSNVTIGSNGITYVIGQNKQDDLYDDTQNGDLSVSGTMGGLGFTLVTDFDSDTKAVAASTTWTAASTAGNGTSKYVDVAAVAAVYESTSFKLSGTAGALGWSLTSTNKNDRGNAASKVVASYAAGDALSFTLTHDTQGKREAINTLAAKYTMDALTISLSAKDDKNHVGNTNKSKKASQNMTIAYANGPWTASFNNDETSQWWSTTKYNLGGGADVFATVDHNEFAVLGMSFSF